MVVLEAQTNFQDGDQMQEDMTLSQAREQAEEQLKLWRTRARHLKKASENSHKLEIFKEDPTEKAEVSQAETRIGPTPKPASGVVPSLIDAMELVFEEVDGSLAPTDMFNQLKDKGWLPKASDALGVIRFKLSSQPTLFSRVRNSNEYYSTKKGLKKAKVVVKATEPSSSPPKRRGRPPKVPVTKPVEDESSSNIVDDLLNEAGL